jgi:hypothetical protein
MENYSLCVNRFDWSEEIIASAITITFIANIMSLFGLGKIAGIIIGLALLIISIVAIVNAVNMGKLDIRVQRPLLTFLVIISLVNMAVITKQLLL